ncbi:MAG: GNAT family protein [Gammaproteobacteria bacterium]|nr:GNAT family protein [Gammaproteobacteria bacterium]
MKHFLQSNRLYLRKLVAGDAEELFAYRSDPEVSCYQGWAPASESDALRFIEEQSSIEPDVAGQWFQLAICLRSDDRLVGDLGLHFPEDDEQQAEFGVSLSPLHQGQGYAGETLRTAMSYLFEKLGKHRVYCSVDPRNSASVAMACRLGMRKEAHFVKSLWFKGEWVDDVVFGLLKSEWRAQRKD